MQFKPCLTQNPGRTRSPKGKGTEVTKVVICEAIVLGTIELDVSSPHQVSLIGNTYPPGVYRGAGGAIGLGWSEGRGNQPWQVVHLSMACFQAYLAYCT